MKVVAVYDSNVSAGLEVYMLQLTELRMCLLLLVNHNSNQICMEDISCDLWRMWRGIRTVVCSFVITFRMKTSGLNPVMRRWYQRTKSSSVNMPYNLGRDEMILLQLYVCVCVRVRAGELFNDTVKSLGNGSTLSDRWESFQLKTNGRKSNWLIVCISLSSRLKEKKNTTHARTHTLSLQLSAHSG
jgi:hypothetical protein